MILETLFGGMTKLSRTPVNYWAESVLDTCLGVSLIVLGLRGQGLTAFAVLATMLLGLVLYSFIEYAVHRFLFHGSFQVLVRSHRAHHDNPLGYDSLPFFLPPLILLSAAAALSLVVRPAVVAVLVGTIALSYVAYGVGHFLIHHHRFRSAAARKWAAHHHIHHYHADANYGVTTPLWDLVLGTTYRYAPVKR